MTDYTIAAVDEALALLLLVGQSPGLGVTELAVRSGNTKARAFRLLYTLEQRNFVVRREPGPSYYLDVQALYIGVAAQDQIDLVQKGRQHLLALGKSCNENVQLRVRDGMECVCVDHWQSLHPVKSRSGAGSRRRLHAGASCKLLLAFAPPEIRHALLGADLPRYTSSTITQRSRLTQELNRIRIDGFSISEGEITEGISAIAAPVLNAEGEVIAALSLSGPEQRIQPLQQKYVELVKQFAARITEDIKTP